MVTHLPLHPHSPHPLRWFALEHPHAPDWILLGLLTLATVLLWFWPA